MASPAARSDAEVVFRQGAPGRVPGRRSLVNAYFWNSFLFEGGGPLDSRVPAPCCAGDREVTYIYVDLSEVDPATDVNAATLRLEVELPAATYIGKTLLSAQAPAVGERSVTSPWLWQSGAGHQRAEVGP